MAAVTISFPCIWFILVPAAQNDPQYNLSCQVRLIQHSEDAGTLLNESAQFDLVDSVDRSFAEDVLERFMGRWMRDARLEQYPVYLDVALRAYAEPQFEYDILEEMDVPRCSVCGGLFDTQSWEERHDLHEPDCLRARSGDPAVHCDCNRIAHAACCPVCNPHPLCANNLAEAVV